MMKQGQCEIERSNYIQRERQSFQWTLEFVSAELFMVKKYLKTRKVLKIFESNS